ncbi:hypothetical protein CL619_02335 [archaeon]|nr:hypothetical protein [archaeon]
MYQPAEDSELLAEVVKKKAFGRVLDMGTGSGIQAFTAAKVPSVRSITAVDINPGAVKQVSLEAKKGNLSKFKVIESDLFSNVEGQFETIIFNPPYLPQDYLETIKGKKKAVEDLALYGGKKGYETIVRFLNQVSKYLARNGKILLLFSSLSGKEKIEETIEKNLLQFVQLKKSKQPMMETLYVYEITALPVRESLVSLGVSDINYLSKGARGMVFKGKFDLNFNQKKFLASKKIRDVAIKIRLESSKAPGTLTLEARNLRLVNKKGIGPKLYYEHKYFLIMELVEGIAFDKFLEEKGKKSEISKKAVIALLHQAFLLDKMKLQKEEMHRPYSNVIVSEINGQVKLTLLDFERCRNSENPSNVTQVISYLMKSGFLDSKEGIKLAEEYKGSYSEEKFNAIFEYL